MGHAAPFVPWGHGNRVGGGRRGRPSGSAPGRRGGRPSSVPSPGPAAGTGPAASPGLRAVPGRGSGCQPPKARCGPWRRVGAAGLSAWSSGRRASAAREAPAGARSFRRPALSGFPRRWTPLPARWRCLAARPSVAAVPRRTGRPRRPSSTPFRSRYNFLSKFPFALLACDYMLVTN